MSEPCLWKVSRNVSGILYNTPFTKSEHTIQKDVVLLSPEFPQFKEYPGPWFAFWQPRTVCILWLGLSYGSPSNNIGFANHLQVFPVGKLNLIRSKQKTHRCWINSNFVNISICWTLRKKRGMFVPIFSSTINKKTTQNKLS